jgi:hypothetical protein
MTLPCRIIANPVIARPIIVSRDNARLKASAARYEAA